MLIGDVSQRRPEWIGSARPNACPNWLSHKFHNQRFGIRCVRAVAHLLQGVRVVTGSQQEHEVFARKLAAILNADASALAQQWFAKRPMPASIGFICGFENAFHRAMYLSILFCRVSGSHRRFTRFQATCRVEARISCSFGWDQLHTVVGRRMEQLQLFCFL